MTKSFKALALPLALLLQAGCGANGESAQSSPQLNRSVADEIAIELGLPADPAPRTVPDAELPRYPVTLDIFRQSDTNPVLGAWREAYVKSLVPSSSLPEDERSRIAERVFKKLARYEFAVLSRSGKPFRVSLVSTGVNAPNGNYRMDVIERTTRLEAEDGLSEPVSIPFPWLTTETLPAAPMTWGLWMHGGYFAQSTPYYADLGLPSVDGGIHQAFPDAMELYSVAQASPTVARIHAAGSAEAAARLRELAPMEWILPRLAESREKIAEVINLLGPEVRVLGHGWVDPLTGDLRRAEWPKCGIFDCFKSWKVERPAE